MLLARRWNLTAAACCCWLGSACSLPLASATARRRRGRAQPLPTRAPAAVSFGVEHPPPSSLARTLSAGRRTQRSRLRSIPAHTAAGRNAPAAAPTRGPGASPLRAAAALAGQRAAAATPASAPQLPLTLRAPPIQGDLALAARGALRLLPLVLANEEAG